MNFKDHFSTLSAQYARYRPNYPDNLFHYLADLCPTQKLAWDCGTGNGQCALRLTNYFEQVVANDPSEPQLACAVKHPRIIYRLATAEEIDLLPQSVDLITVAQAIHWFEFSKFYELVNRVLKAEGVIAVFGYGLLFITPEIDKVLRFFYHDVVGSFWPPERKFIEQEYQTIPFPFKGVNAPPFSMTTEWTYPELIGYLNTWSSTRKFFEKNGRNPILQVEPQLKNAWGKETRKHIVRFPMFFRIGKKDQ